MASAIPPFISQLPWQQLLRPSWLAGAISIGFHSVLFAAGPTFPSLGFNQLVEPELTAERRNVPLVELTPAEQQRLPDFSGSLYDFDAFGSLEPLAPLFGDSPASGSSSGITSQKPSGSRPSSSTSTSLPFGITRIESRPGPLTQFPNPFREPNPAATEPEPGAPGPDASAAPGDEETPDPTATETQDEPSAADLAGATDEASTAADDEVAASGNPAEVMTLEERLLAYTFDVAETEPEVSQERLAGWLETGQALATELELDPTLDLVAELEAAVVIAEEDPDSDLDSIFQRPIALTLDHEAGICLTKEPQKGLIGAWVSPEGTLLGEPEVIRSTGYGGLNQQAVRYIEELNFSEVETFTGYQFEVAVNYDPEGCVELEGDAPAASEDTPAAGLRQRSDSTETPPDKDAPAAETDIPAASPSSETDFPTPVPAPATDEPAED
ncbi:MAG: hypothetical protein AAFR26_10280 [Cyanobacteria bacterium J06626_4]